MTLGEKKDIRFQPQGFGPQLAATIRAELGLIFISRNNCTCLSRAMIGHVVDRCLDELMFEVMLILEGSSLSLQIALLCHFQTFVFLSLDTLIYSISEQMI